MISQSDPIGDALHSEVSKDNVLSWMFGMSKGPALRPRQRAGCPRNPQVNIESSTMMRGMTERLLPGGNMEGKAADVIHVSMGEQHSPLEGTALGAASGVQS